MRNRSIQKIASLLGVETDSKTQVAGYQIDSRLVEPGDLFFALAGERSDGHRLWGVVRPRGGVGAVVDAGYGGPDFGLELVRVGDVLGSLQGLARWSMGEEKGLQIVGVTGSVGKTTTKEFVAALLGGRYRVGKNLRSYNTKITYPLTLLNREEGLEVLVVELGMERPGDIGRLLEVAAPDIAVVTKVALAHAAFFPEGLGAIAREKGSVFSHPRTRLAIFSHGLHDFPEVVAGIGCKRVSFSLEERGADYFMAGGVVDERGVRAYQFELPFKQPHLLHNFLGAVCVARAMKMEWDEIHQRVGQLVLPKMRFEQFERAGILFINDAYNANPESMRAALSNLPEPLKEGGKRIGVLGTMRDLGHFSQKAHEEVGRFAQKYLDHLLVLGEEATPLCEVFQEVKKPAELFLDQHALVERLRELMYPGDVVLVKGSRGMKMENLFELLDVASPC